MEMNFTSKIFNTSAIYYYASQKEKEAHLIGKLANVTKSSPKKPTDGKETTKSWVLQSFYPRSKAADNNSATVASNRKPSASAPVKKKIPDHKGEPTVRFDQSLINSYGEKFKFCVVGKFPGSRPSLAQIRKWVAKEWKLKGDCFITLLDPHHIFVRLESQDDMIYVWSRNRWLINGRHLMKVFRWSTKFRPAAGEPSLAAVWISLPLLPVVFFQEELLFSVASVVGRVLAMDGPTRNLTRTNVARVCLEVDLLKELPRRVRIEIGDEGFWQDIDYEKLPSFCTVCQQQGHSIEICKLGMKNSEEKAGNLNSNSSLENPNSEIKNGRRSEVLVTEVKHPNLVIGDKTENDQAVTEGSCHLPLNGCSPEESSKKNKMDASDSRGECSDVVTTDQSLTANGPSKLSANQVAVLEKTDDLIKAGTSKVVQDEMLQGENTLLQVEEEEVEEEEEEEGKCDDDGELVHIETKRSDKAEENHRGEETESVTNKRRKKGPGRTSPSSRRKSSSNKPIFFWKRKQKYTHPIEAIPEVAGLIRYSYSDVKKMTKSFREVIGNGGFCEVYKGELPDGHLVAVKVMNVHEHFMNEINIMKRTSHVNIVSVLGFCLEEPRRAIVYEFLPNASLDKLLYPQEGLFSLGDEILHQIAVGIARGLGYLHHGCSTSIVHFDIKPGNILLDQNFRPKICDFGLARLWPNDWTCTVSRIAGTIGYMAPELFREHNFSDKTDVYAYGTTLLEMVVRRRPIDVTAREKDLRGWVYRHLNPEGQGYIEGVAVTESMRKMILVGLSCVQGDPVLRPSISRVVQMLEGNINELRIPPNPSSTPIFTASYSLSFEEPRYSREGNYGVNTRGVGSSESEGAISCTNSSLIGR